jgi:subtilisin family serine protease
MFGFSVSINMTTLLRTVSAALAAALLLPAAGASAGQPAAWRPNDPLFASQWSLEQSSDVDIDAPEAWALLQEIGVHQEVIVAVVDSGFDIDHEDLRDMLWVNPGEIPGNGIDDDGNGYVDDVHGWDFNDGDSNVFDGSHGTGVAGIIAAAADNGVGIAGIAAPAGVKLMLLRGTAHNSAGQPAIDAWEYALAHGAHVVNNSWGAATQGINVVNMALRDERLHATSRKLSEAGLVQVFAGGYTTGPWPDVWDDFDFPGVLRVTVSDSNDDISLGTHPNPATIEIAAPTDVISARPGNAYGQIGGTSGAAPHVAGAAALVRAAFPQLTNAQVADAIMRGVDQPGPSFILASRSGGRLNALGALRVAQALASG